MTTQPLNRDQQIALMTGARDRRAAAVERWSQNPEVQQMLRQPAGRADAHSLEQAGDELHARPKVVGA